MAENSSQAPRRAATTVPRMIALALAVLVLAVLLLLLLRLFALGDEPPVRVRNGSMNIELVQGQWDDGGDGWSPSTGWLWGTFEVKVTSANGHACNDGQAGNGKEVLVQYSDSDRTEISSTSAGPIMGKTRVRPKNKLERVSPQLLRHGGEPPQDALVPPDVDEPFRGLHRPNPGRCGSAANAAVSARGVSARRRGRTPG